MSKQLYISLIFFNFLFVITASSQKQELHTNSKKATQYYNTAIQAYNKYNYEEAINFLDKATAKDSNFIECYFLKAELFNLNNDYENEITNYERAISIDPDLFKMAHYNLAIAQLKTGNYIQAKLNFENFKDIEKNSEKPSLKLSFYIAQCEFAINAIENPVKFNPKSISDSINTKYNEYWPTLTADESILIFTRLIPRNNSNSDAVSFKTFHEDIYLSHKTDSGWSLAKNAGNKVNSIGNEGTQSISVDGKYYFFTACDRPGSYGGCDIYYVEKLKQGWSEPTNVGPPVNTRYKETQPSISADGQTLFFISNRPGGIGKQDIWKCSMSEKGEWLQPINLGNSVNTIEDESSPFMHPDGSTLYFASKGHMGMGGIDLFMSKYENGKFTKPKNLGYPINTQNDEKGLIVNVKGTEAYFSSNREENKGLDIYKFNIYDDIKPKPVTYIKGYIADATTKKRLFAKIELIEIASQSTFLRTVSDETNGKYLACIPLGYDYALNVSKHGYLFFSENFSLKDSIFVKEPYLLNVELQAIEIGSTGILKNIFFETDSYLLKMESYVELNKLIEFLNINPHIEIELSGHTDFTGKLEYNIELSEKRAKSVYDYLIAHNIDESRLTFSGYGSSTPIADNKTSEGRAKNRRTEFKITKK